MALLSSLRLAAGAAALLLAASGAGATHGQSLEPSLKAAYLFNFARFVEWPDGAGAPGSPVTICVPEDDPVGHALDTAIAGRNVKGRPLAVRRLPKGGDVTGCAIVYVGAAGSAPDSAAPRTAAGTPVLVVGEGEAFAQERGAIGFVVENDRVRFDINRGAAAASGLRISSQLLGVARRVIDGGRAGGTR